MAGQRLNLKPIGNVCGKARFHDRAAAEGWAAFQRERNGSQLGHALPGCKLAVYWCDGCRAYHTGHRRNAEGW